LTETLQQGLPELELTEAHIQRLQGTESPNWQAAPTSMELYFQVLADSAEALDRGEYRLYSGGNPGSQMAYRTFGRFADMLEAGYAKALQDATQREEALEPEAIWAEVSYLPHSGRTTNVVLTRHARAYEIPMGTNASTDAEHTIPVDDLVVGSNEKYFYLKSRRWNREVIPTATHMLNFMNTPNVYRFLREVGLARHKQWGPFSWGVLASASHLPRVRYGRVVLQPAQWRVRPQDAWCADSMSEDAFFQAVQAWRDAMKVPQLVFLSHFDNRMLLDLTQRHHVEELRKELRKTNSVTLIETGQMEARSIVRGPDGSYASEFVFSLIKREAGAGRIARRAVRSGYEGPRVYLPGSEWMYLKLYGNELRQDELIATKLIELLSSLSQQGQIDMAYFLRYSDPEVHLRLRLHGQPEVLSASVMPEVHRFSQELQQEGLLSKLVLDSYEPEIERYGGPELMKLAEQVFHADTRVVANWVQAKRFGGWQLAPDLIGVLSVLDYLEHFGYSFSEQAALMDQSFGSKEHLDLFRTYRKQILELVESPDPLLARMFAFRAPFVKRYAEQARAAEARGELYGSYNDLVFSVIHMHMNRFYGLDRKQEQKTYILTRHALQALKHFRRDRS
jgi:thiopeptide-type bacteriocin biosynthesis protein